MTEVTLESIEVPLDRFERAHADGAVVVDVREPFEYDSGHVPGARLIPMGELPRRLDELSTEEPLYVICASGARSSAITSYLRQAGYHAHSVAGGTNGWARSGRPIVHGTTPHGEWS